MIENEPHSNKEKTLEVKASQFKKRNTRLEKFHLELLK